MLLALAASAGALWLALESFAVANSHLQYHRLATELSFWSRPGYRPTEATRSQTRAALEVLRQAYPHYADYSALAAYNAYWEWYFSGDESFARETLARQQAALAQRPARYHDWRTLAGYAEALGRREVAQTAEARSAALLRHARYNGAN